MELSYVAGGASLGRLANGGDADDARAVVSADDCASSTSNPVVCREQAAEVTWITQRSNCIQLYSRAWCLI